MRLLNSTLLSTVLLIASACSAGDVPASETVAHAGSSAPAAAPAAKFEQDLLRIAHEAASAFPLNPHIKNRSRAQARVVEACLELDQPALALETITSIANWQRGTGFADLAAWHAERGNAEEAREWIRRAQEVLDGPMDANEQSWRPDRIRAKIARALLLLGDEEKAARLEAGLEGPERALVEELRARELPGDRFESKLSALRALVPGGSFDHLSTVIRSGIELWGNFYDDAERAGQVEELVRAAWAKLPLLVRLEALEHMTQVANEHSDRARALSLIGEIEEFIDTSRWDTKDLVEWRARLASLQHAAGEVDVARRQLERALATFDEAQEQIINIYRAGALRHIAATYAAMGEHDAARAIWARALEQGVVNINSRPRADDLVDTCISIAKSGVEPTPELMQRIREIRAGLRDPW